MNIRNDLYNSQNFPMYGRNGKMNSGDPNRPPFTHRLAAQRAASTTPIHTPPPGSPEEERLPLKEPIETQPIPLDRDQKKDVLTVATMPEQTEAPTREELERRVRLLKRRREKCPFTGPNGECYRPDIRCGERSQFSGRETEKQHAKPHHCLYTPFFPADSIVIVEDDKLQREFLLNTFKLFFQYDMEKITALSAAEQATDLLGHFKLQDRPVGLILLDCSTLGAGAPQLLNELYDRNLAAEIILMGCPQEDEIQMIKKFKNMTLAPDEPFISAYLKLPIHTEAFVETIKSLNFGRFL